MESVELPNIIFASKAKGFQYFVSEWCFVTVDFSGITCESSLPSVYHNQLAIVSCLV